MRRHRSCRHEPPDCREAKWPHHLCAQRPAAWRIMTGLFAGAGADYKRQRPVSFCFAIKLCSGWVGEKGRMAILCRRRLGYGILPCPGQRVWRLHRACREKIDIIPRFFSGGSNAPTSEPGGPTGSHPPLPRACNSEQLSAITRLLTKRPHRKSRAGRRYWGAAAESCGEALRTGLNSRAGGGGVGLESARRAMPSHRDRTS